MADVTDATFATDVVERSKTVPVVVDLWAEWCGPCKSLGPILEKVIGETQGLVELAKVDVDANPEVSAAFQVQSIPAVYAMIDGKVVDGFVGAQGEPEVVEFVQRVLNADVGGAGAVVDEADGDEPLAADQPVATSQPIAADQPAPAPQISEPGMDSQPIVATPMGPSAEEADAIEAQLVELLPKVKDDEDARAKFVELLAELGPEDPRTNNYRRKLASSLY